ncbi:MAG: phosphatidylglycerophosphatase A [Phycisphaerae bacterium]|nr:phosphatidylglycerophosphatase A [Phycisphaerae bacterium]
MGVRKLIVTGFGTGYLPASGTWGSLVTVAIFLAVAWVGSCSSWAMAQWAMVATAVLASVACVAFGDFTERTWKKKDPKYCTIDEVAGQAVALLGVPVTLPAGECTWKGWLITAGVCFVLFRIMDVLKPPPARQFEKLPKGWGVLMDDIMAGVYANIVAQVIFRAGIL